MALDSLDLETAIRRMTTLVVENLHRASRALVLQDEALAREVIEADRTIDQLEEDLGDHCGVVIARKQPVARELRRILGYIKLASNLERIGDYGVHAARLTLELSQERYVKELVDLPEMIEIGITMVQEAVKSYLDQNPEAARQTALLDKKMDEKNRTIYRDLLGMMKNDSRTIAQATQMLFLSRVLERLGDHAVSICQQTVYSATGRHEDL